MLEGIDAKICNTCGDMKSFDSFSKKKSGKYGFNSQCKVCKCEYDKKKYNKNKDCYKESNKKYRHSNKSKISNKDRVYYENNKNKIKERRKIYYQNNKEYFIEKSRYRRVLEQESKGNFTEKEFVKYSLDFFGWKCAYSGLDIRNDKSNCHRDHIIPISKCGDNGIWNIVPSLDYINLSKSDANMEEWYRKQDYFTEKRLNKIYEYINTMKKIFEKE